MAEWICIEERLLELIAKVIWYDEHGNTIVGTYTKLGWTFSYYPGVLTHWQPMPELSGGES